MPTLRTLLFAGLLVLPPTTGVWAQCIDGDCYGGRGAFIDEYDNVLVGEFVGGLLSGQGSCHYNWGARYRGQLLDGHPHGHGTYGQATGQAQLARWQHGYILHLLKDTFADPLPPPIVVLFVPDAQLSPFFERDLHELMHFFAPSEGLLPARDIITLRGPTATLDSLHAILRQPHQGEVLLFVLGQLADHTLAPHQANATPLAQLLTLSRQYTTPQCAVFAFLHLYQEVPDPEPTELQATARQGQLLPLNTFALTASRRPWVEFDGLRTSVFLHYCLLGLRGAADANMDAFIQAQELYDFLDRKLRQRLAQGLLPAQLSSHGLTGLPLPASP